MFDTNEVTPGNFSLKVFTHFFPLLSFAVIVVMAIVVLTNMNRGFYQLNHTDIHASKINDGEANAGGQKYKIQQVILLVVAENIVRKITNDISVISSGVAESTVTYMTTADASSEKPKNQVMLLQAGLEMRPLVENLSCYCSYSIYGTNVKRDSKIYMIFSLKKI
jgi:hypothetical protein